VILVAARKRRTGLYPKRPARKPWWAWRPASGRDWLLTGSVLAVVAGLAVVVVWWLVAPSRYVPPARQRQYLPFAAGLTAMASKTLDGAIETEPLVAAAVRVAVQVDVPGPVTVAGEQARLLS